LEATTSNSAKEHAFLFAGTSNRSLAQEIADISGIPLGKVVIDEFPDGEINIEILECVRGCDLFVVQSIATRPNYYLMELMIMIDALRRASAKSITVVIPYFGYCRQDRKADGARVPITAKLVANLLETAGATQLITMDLHAPQIQGFFDIPVDDILAAPLLLEKLATIDFHDFVVVTPDIGSVKLASKYARISGVEYVIIDKSRLSATEVAINNLYGDVKGKNVLLIDDICSTASTLVAAASTCQAAGASRIVSLITHGLFVAEAIHKIEASPIEALIISNTIPLTGKALASQKLIVASVAKLFATAIRCILASESMWSLSAQAAAKE
jgi:ribose-phosphate pyrophosphokinase